MHPSFEQFVSALRDPSLRAGIGLTISDADATALLSQQDWATDYYHQWLAMFPAAQAPAAPAAPAAAPQAPAGPAFGPPPSAAAAPPPAFAPWPDATTSTTQLGSGSRVPSGVKRLLIIGGSVVAAVLLVVVGVSVYRGAVTGSVTHPNAGSATSASSAPLPADLHGLSAREYPLIEAVFESEDRTIPQMVAQGMTDERIGVLRDTVVPQADKACAAVGGVQNGFDNPSYKSSFIAGYIATAKVTPDKAGIVYDAIAAYCAAA